MTLARRIAAHGDRVAIAGGHGLTTYRQLDLQSQQIAAGLLDRSPDLAEARIAFFLRPGADYVATLLGIWRAGGVAVPLALSHPPPELEYVVRDSGASILVAAPEDMAVIEPIARAAGARAITPADLSSPGAADLPEVEAGRRAMILYTSGTTARPKGVVTTHANIAAQITSLIQAWEWSSADRTLLVLPLHHVHGIVNVVGCAGWAGAVCDTPGGFSADATWDRLASGEISVFTAVPTVYRRLIASWDRAGAAARRARSEGCRRVRLMMSGSAALPVATLERWREITGHVLLERYGMTEIGMGLSNPLRGERRPGFVGTPLPGVEVRLVAEDGSVVDVGAPGEIEVRGPGVFLEYWQRPGETASAFRDGWFRTGDVAIVEDGAYRLLGRTSIDIIKTGGFKVSALEIEEVLRRHPAVAECAVVGIDDPEWGQRVSAAVELRPPASLSLDELSAWARERLAPYKLPRALRCVATLPRNAMGKVLKPEVVTLFKREDREGHAGRESIESERAKRVSRRSGAGHRGPASDGDGGFGGAEPPE